VTDTFKDQDFGKRFAQMGDLAEGKCIQWLQENNTGFVRYGLDRPPLRMDMLPARIRHTPDILTSRGLIEVKGFGRDQVAKLKLEDMNCLSWWNDCHPVSIFFYDSCNDRSICVGFTDVRDKMVADQRVKLGVFPDANPKPYFAIPAAVIWGE